MLPHVPVPFWATRVALYPGAGERQCGDGPLPIELAKFHFVASPDDPVVFGFELKPFQKMP
jgi:hypothetical protein